MDMNQYEIDKLNRGRTLRMALPELTKILNEQLDAAIYKMCGRFTGGQTEFIGNVAEISTIIELRDSLQRDGLETEHMEEKLHGG